MENSKGCHTCRFVKAQHDGPTCSPCLDAYQKDGTEPNWQPPVDFDADHIELQPVVPIVPGHPLYRETLPENPKAIHGRAKPSLALFPAGAIVPTCEVFQLGAEKYGPFNWRKDPVQSMTYANAALRHIFSWIDGADQDHESGVSDLAHGIACLSIVLDAMATGKLIDDRPHKGVAQELIQARTKTASLT